VTVTPKLETFPLAEGIFAQIAEAIDDLELRGEGMFVTETTAITSELLRYWFNENYCELRQANFHKGQRDAILATIYAHEILKTTTLADLYRHIAPDALLEGDRLTEVTDSRNKHPKYAAKMATGTGKTWVLNALLIWQYLNATAEPADVRFSSNFLIVAPGLIVYDRLLDSFQGKLRDGTRHFETSDIYSVRDLFVPSTYEASLFGFLQGAVVTKKDIGRKVTGGGVIAITNWHLLTGDEDPDFVDDDEQIIDAGSDVDEKAMVADLLPLTPGVAAGNSLETLDRRARRGEALEFLIDLPSLVVFNDEAHHIHALKKGEEVSEVEWQKSLRKIAVPKAQRFVQVDFSATPYNEVGGGRAGKSKRYFPHIVVDFDLRSAMSQGLVKTLLLDRRQEIAALPLEFKVERDESGNVSLSHGQKTMLRAGLERLNILAAQFATVDPGKHPKMMVVVEDTAAAPLVEAFFLELGLSADDVLSVHSGKKSELGLKEWEPVREKLFALDSTAQPRVVISVLMLREGFDVNNICVIVPLRASQASILLEQTIGRGLRLMWRGDAVIDELKAESRKLIREKREPSNYFDMLFVVEHPAFVEFYDELMNGAAGVIDADGESPDRAKGDIEKLELRAGFDQYDFEIPIIIRDPEVEMREPVVDPLTLKVSKFEVEYLRTLVGQGDKFTAEAVENGVRFGDYRIDGGVMTATGYNDFLSRLANRIVSAHQRAFATTSQQFNHATEFPVFKAYQRLVIGWLDTYLRERYFGPDFRSLDDENWRLLLVPGVAEEISGEIGRTLVELQENVTTGGAEVLYRYASEVDSITVRASSSVTLTKCIFDKQPYPSNSGGLERDFMTWVDNDGKVEALLKIHEYKHDFLRRPYLKADGMPALYLPDFLVRTVDRVYLVETKSQSGLADANVQRKKRSAVSWVKAINELDEDQRGGRTWFYALAGESAVRAYMDNGGTASDFLATAALVDNVIEELGTLF
jgi:type III restriction enzyme